MSLRGLILTSNMGLPVLLFCHFCISNVDSYYLFVFLSVRFDCYTKDTKRALKESQKIDRRLSLTKKNAKSPHTCIRPSPQTLTPHSLSHSHTQFFFYSSQDCHLYPLLVSLCSFNSDQFDACAQHVAERHADSNVNRK